MSPSPRQLSKNPTTNTTQPLVTPPSLTPPSIASEGAEAPGRVRPIGIPTLTVVLPPKVHLVELLVNRLLDFSDTVGLFAEGAMESIDAIINGLARRYCAHANSPMYGGQEANVDRR
jgi:hypothetical protein